MLQMAAMVVLVVAVGHQVQQQLEVLEIHLP
jgi:hypothetical protein